MPCRQFNQSESFLTSVTDALNYSVSTSYDYNNIPSKTVDKRGNPSTFSSHFSNNSSTSTRTDPLNYSSSTYDAKNKVVQSMDALGNTTANTYTQDSKEDLLTTGVTGTGSAPFKATSKVNTYDHNGNRLTQAGSGAQSQSFGYDAHDKLVSGTGETDGYDLNGNLLTRTLGGQRTTYTWDDEDRLTSVTTPGSITDTFTYTK